MEATATVQTADFTKLAEQLVELSKFFESIQKSTKVYGDNKEGTKVMKLGSRMRRTSSSSASRLPGRNSRSTARSKAMSHSRKSTT